MARDEDEREEYEDGRDAVTRHDLADGEDVGGLVAPIAGLVQQLRVVGLPDGERPIVAEPEPD